MADDESFIDVSVAQDGGVQKKILTAAPEGAQGPPPNGNEVEAHYTGEFFSPPLPQPPILSRIRLYYYFITFVLTYKCAVL